MHGVVVVGGLDHVVLLVAAQTVLRAERRGQLQVVECRQGVDRVFETRRHRGGVCKQRHTPARQWCAQVGVREQTVDAELDHGPPWGGSSVAGGRTICSTKPSG